MSIFERIGEFIGSGIEKTELDIHTNQEEVLRHQRAARRLGLGALSDHGNVHISTRDSQELQDRARIAAETDDIGLVFPSED